MNKLPQYSLITGFYLSMFQNERFQPSWRLFLLIGLVILFALTGCQPRADFDVQLSTNAVRQENVFPLVSSDVIYHIGYDPRLEPKDDVRQLASLAKWLENQTGLPFGILITSPNQLVPQSLCKGEADFAVVGTVSYLQAYQLCKAHILVRGLNSEGKDTYRAAIVVSPDSQLRELSDLRGHSFAFGAFNSTQGHLIPRLMLEQAGVNLQDLGSYIYTGSHTATANAVSSRQVDAGALQDTLAFSLAQRGLLRILALSAPYPSSGIVVAPHVPDTVAQRVQQALLSLEPLGKDAAWLYEWQHTEMPLGFARAADTEYQDLFEVAKQIGLLDLP